MVKQSEQTLHQKEIQMADKHRKKSQHPYSTGKSKLKSQYQDKNKKQALTIPSAREDIE